MNNPMFTDERNVLILLALLKAHGIRRVVANPGTTNIPVLAGVQKDPFFSVHSAVDERHGAYLACGMSVASGEPVVLSCTGATASRNYLPAMTEAFYRKIPLLVVTSSQEAFRAGHLHAQMTDRSAPPPDSVRASFRVPPIRSEGDAARCKTTINQAILELFRHGGGPVHVNLETNYKNTYTTEQLPTVSAISRIDLSTKEWPALPDHATIAVWIGSHKPFSEAERAALEHFILAHNAVVLTDHTGSYDGPRSILSSLVCSQSGTTASSKPLLRPDLIVHIGEISGDSPSIRFLTSIAPVWRVSPDGEIRNLLGRLERVFEMPETAFFRHYGQSSAVPDIGSFFEAWQTQDASLREKIPALPFSNVWIASRMASHLPKGSIIHFGILNSLRSWNYFPLPTGVAAFANVGGFGIDGCVSSLIGASLVHPDILHFGIVGDLAFFYDFNALGNRHIGKNIRLLLVNNGTGEEFNRNENPGSRFGSQVNDFIAAGGHFGNKSRSLVKHFAEDLGLRYRAAEDKESFESALPEFLSDSGDSSILFECFTKTADESEALTTMCSLEPPETASPSARQRIGRLVPGRVKNAVRELFK